VNREDARARVASLLAEDVDAAVARGRSRFQDVAARCSDAIVLFGSGALGRDCLARLRAAGRTPVAFADNNRTAWGREVEGVPVLSPADAAALYPDALFVATVYTNVPVLHQLADLGVQGVSFPSLAWSLSATFLPFWAVDLPLGIHRERDAVLSAVDLWADDESRAEYAGQLAWRTSLSPAALPPHRPAADLYFPDDLMAPLPDEAFVDCGAFDGDTVRRFLDRRAGRFGRIVAFEPDADTFPRLRQFVASLDAGIASRVSVVHSALGAGPGTIAFSNTGTVASRSGQGSAEAPLVSLDDALAGQPVTFIKIDVEGAEPEVLRGAARILRERRPVVAACLYHRQEDLWRIPRLLRDLSPDHRLYLRRYSDECWELVCYAVPDERLVDAGRP